MVAFRQYMSKIIRVNIFIICLHGDISRHFHYQTHEKLVYFFVQLYITQARWARLISLKTLQVTYAWQKCAIFGACSKFFLTILVFQITGTQNSGNWKNVQNFVSLNRVLRLPQKCIHPRFLFIHPRLVLLYNQ